MDCCNNPPIDQKIFKKMVDSWGKDWSKHTYEAQGEITEEIAKRLQFPDVPDE